MPPSSLSLFDLAPGRTLLDRYAVLEPHRENGMAAAFAVQDNGSAERLELQAFPGSLFENHEQARAFAAQLERWTELDCDVVIVPRQVDVLDDGAVLVVAPFPPGATLRAWCGDAARLPQADVCALGVRLLDGLVEAHERGLVHGDVKPETIWVDAGVGDSRLVDAGVTSGLWASKHLGTRTALIGTPFYAPIEMFGGDSPDEVSDVYNLATVLYELLVGQLPWAGKSYIEVFQSKMQPGPPSMRSIAPDVEVDDELESVLAHALRGKRKERYQSAAAFRDHLAELDVG